MRECVYEKEICEGEKMVLVGGGKREHAHVCVTGMEKGDGKRAGKWKGS